MREGGEEMLERALKVEREVLREEFVFDIDEGSFLVKVFEKARQELGFDERLFRVFLDRVREEFSRKGWVYYKFRNGKGETILNAFKKVIYELSRAEGVGVSNDAISRILNYVRSFYAFDGELWAGLYMAEAFWFRKKWGIDRDLGDGNSCFCFGGCNEGNVDWLINEGRVYSRVYFVVFYYSHGKKEGWGRCWVYKLDGILYATNFYSSGFEIKSLGMREAVKRLLLRLFDMYVDGDVVVEENVNGVLRIYENGDGILFFNGRKYKDKNEVLEYVLRQETVCVYCGRRVMMKEMKKYEDGVLYKNREVMGLIVCSSCFEELQPKKRCEECGGAFSVGDLYYVRDYGYVCFNCLRKGWKFCDACGEAVREEEAVYTRDGVVFCQECADEYGAFCFCCEEFYYFDKEENDGVEIGKYKVNVGCSVYELYFCDKCAERYLASYECVDCGRVVQVYYGHYVGSDLMRVLVSSCKCYECYVKSLWEDYKEKRQLRLFDDVIDRLKEFVRSLK
jgi:hypothetical protein